MEHLGDTASDKPDDFDFDETLNLIATRDRMLQLSQERNIYKKKIIYLLFSIIIAILIITILLFTIYNKKKYNKI